MFAALVCAALAQLPSPVLQAPIIPVQMPLTTGTFAKVAEVIKPAVVNINTESTIKNPHRRGGPGGPGQQGPGGGDDENPFDDFFDRFFGGPGGGGAGGGQLRGPGPPGVPRPVDRPFRRGRPEDIAEVIAYLAYLVPMAAVPLLVAALMDPGLGIIVALVMMVVLCADVFLGVFSRYVMARTFTWYDEIARLLFVWIVFLGAAVGVRRSAHFRLHLLVDRFPPGLRRVAHVVGVLVVMGILLLTNNLALLSAGLTQFVPNWPSPSL